MPSLLIYSGIYSEAWDGVLFFLISMDMGTRLGIEKGYNNGDKWSQPCMRPTELSVPSPRIGVIIFVKLSLIQRPRPCLRPTASRAMRE